MPIIYLSPSTQEELESSIRYMLASGENQIIFYYPRLSDDEVRELMSQLLSIIKGYC